MQIKGIKNKLIYIRCGLTAKDQKPTMAGHGKTMMIASNQKKFGDDLRSKWHLTVSHRLTRYQRHQIRQNNEKTMDHFMKRCWNQATRGWFRDLV